MFCSAVLMTRCMKWGCVWLRKLSIIAINSLYHHLHQMLLYWRRNAEYSSGDLADLTADFGIFADTLVRILFNLSIISRQFTCFCLDILQDKKNLDAKITAPSEKESGVLLFSQQCSTDHSLNNNDHGDGNMITVTAGAME